MKVESGGAVSQLLADVSVPPMFYARQRFDTEHIAPSEIPSVIIKKLRQEPFCSKIRPGMEIAITATAGPLQKDSRRCWRATVFPPKPWVVKYDPVWKW